MTESDNQRELLQVTVAAPIATVWRALKDPAEIRRWFGWEYEGLEDEIRMIFGDESIFSEEEHSVRLDYGTGKVDEFRLEPLDASSTRLRIIQSAPPGHDWDAIYDDIGEGWTSFVHQLRFALGRHPGEDRRTLYLSGHRPAADSASPAEAVGLGAIDDVAEGARYGLTAANGEELAGEVWYRSPHQVGLTVDGYGDGLLIVTTDPVSNKPPHGGGTAIVTTYGLDAEGFDRVSRAWTDWWRALFPESLDEAPAG